MCIRDRPAPCHPRRLRRPSSPREQARLRFRPPTAVKKLRVRTVILSDIHLGTADSKVSEVNHFLRHVRCEKLILNGDIIDGWQLKRSGQWTKSHTHFIRIVLKMLEKRDTKIVYLRGNPVSYTHLRIP